MIVLKGICKGYDRPGEPRLEVLKHVDLTVRSGDFAAIVGPSGSGKTTLINLIGLLDRADAGDYTLEGERVAQLTARRCAELRNRRIGFVFQQFHLLPRTTALENVALPLLYAKHRDPETRAAQALARVGLADRLRHKPNELSGGQQQRVAIARALVNDPAVILADEPTGNLDRESGARIMAMLEELHEEGRTILMITHDRDNAARAERVLTIDDGVLTEGPGSRGGAS